ncbi:tetratricopeptide repeat protein [Levilactobacillus bambusae]|uniref:Uncharacterized protein n=1 Tax=Levilactobacillus bambusae TaxID=2024736 RepID=A0A2V1N487_9LACO|nr:tetratricopeptide repeat protein [Levilactobacillus bambusae]PWG00805.1 hypothetical protein DCM90_01105 [Levilactobacillus bambusae]
MSYAEQALDQLEKGQLDDFKKAYNSALRHDDDETLFSLAEELYGLGFLNQSRRIYEKLLKQYPDEDELRTNLADIAIDEDKTDVALDYLNQIKPESTAYVQALLVSADLYQTQGLFEVSQQKLLEAQDIAPEEPVITFALAELYFNMREFNRAVPLYLDLIKSGVTNLSRVNLVERLGVSYAEAGRFEQAIGYLEQIHEGDMTPDVQFELGFTYLQLEDFERAAKVLGALQESDSQYSSLYPYLGMALEQLNQLDEALKMVQVGLGVDQYNEKLWRQAAHLATRVSDESLAETYLKKATELDPDDLTAALELSNLYVKQGRWQETIDLLLADTASDDLDPQFFWNLATAYTHEEQYEQAAKYYDEARPYFMDQPDFLKPAIYFYREMGQTDVVRELLSRYVQLVPDDEEMQYMWEAYEN